LRASLDVSGGQETGQSWANWRGWWWPATGRVDVRISAGNLWRHHICMRLVGPSDEVPICSMIDLLSCSLNLSRRPPLSLVRRQRLMDIRYSTRRISNTRRPSSIYVSRLLGRRAQRLHNSYLCR